ncbi:hypothetical protein [Nocardia sp. NPDC058705]|uniref:hypothetical protein n=1 Tax=Nocardia sp. NPDC058705 TaxID=3346609 RepID=UPI0036CF0D90
MPMADAEDRAWAIRDGVLGLLYHAEIAGQELYSISAAAVSRVSDWGWDPINELEIIAASEYLVRAGFVRSHMTQANGMLIMPTMTASGVQKASNRISVRPGVDSSPSVAVTSPAPPAAPTMNGEDVTTEISRMWSIRDAILAWLYQEDAALREPTHVDAERIQESVSWQAAPITDEELSRDCRYLIESGYMRATATMQGVMLRPLITARGSDFAARGVSVQPGPERFAATTGVTNTFNITNNGPSQMAIQSTDFTQTLTVEGQRQQIDAVATALDEYAAQSPEAAGRVGNLPDELREAGSDPVANRGKLQTLLSAVVGIGALANSAGGQQLMQLAAPLIQSLAS